MPGGSADFSSSGGIRVSTPSPLGRHSQSPPPLHPGGLEREHRRVNRPNPKLQLAMRLLIALSWPALICHCLWCIRHACVMPAWWVLRGVASPGALRHCQYVLSLSTPHTRSGPECSSVARILCKRAMRDVLPATNESNWREPILLYLIAWMAARYSHCRSAVCCTSNTRGEHAHLHPIKPKLGAYTAHARM